MHPSELLRLFDAWESRTRGLEPQPHRVPIEPAFAPLFASARVPRAVVDDGRRPGLLDRVRGARRVAQAPETSASDQVPLTEESEGLAEFDLSVPAELVVKPDAARNWLASLHGLRGRASFEIAGAAGEVRVSLSCTAADRPLVAAATKAQFPEIGFRLHKSGGLLGSSADTVAMGFGLRERVFRELNTVGRLDPDPITGAVGVLDQLDQGESALIQVLFRPAKTTWRAEFESFATSIEDVDHALPMIRAKFAEPLFAVVLRIAAFAPTEPMAAALAHRLGAAITSSTRAPSNELVHFHLDEHEFQDFVDRTTHRSGMLLSLPELLTLVHPPSASVRSPSLRRRTCSTRAAPDRFTQGAHIVLGTNEHEGESRRVGLSVEDRLRHTYVVGASGTGKSTLLLSMALQDAEAGNGFAVLDPHGDLIDDIVARLPEYRVRDVLLFDPADEEFPVGFNILKAHSELERTLLASDLVSVFKRLSTSFGDQMTTVLGNAVLAFLEHEDGGTLFDLRRFLIDRAFRARILGGVRDEQVVAYWQEEFSLLKGLPHAPILTRLSTFLRPRLIRNMVAQKDDRLNLRELMDGRGILLAKLPQGAIGEENAHLLGSLLVGRIAQTAMSRQDEAASKRVPFYLYIDEFHHFITPSVTSILSGARKYGLGLTLSHQELRQMKSRSEDVAASVLGNANTRVVFRVGDQDARSLADGFSHFVAKDLQNLGIGESLARIERPDFDFNLRTDPAPVASATNGRQRRLVVRESSRTRYARPRAEIEELLRLYRADTTTGEPAAPARATRRRGSRSADVPAPLVAGQSTGPLPGRGGPQHKYLQTVLRKLAEDRGFTVTIEKRVLDGHGHIDVFLERGELTIGCEVSVSTDAEHESQNVAKCLAAGVGVVALVSDDERVLADVRSRFNKTDGRRLRFVAPERLVAFLDEFAPTADAPTPHLRGPRARVGTAGRTEMRMLITEDAAKYLGVATQTLAKLRWSGDSPPYFKVGRRVLYDLADLDAWLQGKRLRSTSDGGGA